MGACALSQTGWLKRSEKLFFVSKKLLSFFFLKHPVKWSVSLQCARKKNFVRDEVKKATIYSENFLDEKKLRAKNSYYIIADIYATN